MSIVVIPGAAQPALSDGDLDGLLAALNIQVGAEDKAAYKPVLRAFLAVMHKVGADPEYTPPALVPRPTVGGGGGGGRRYEVPAPAANPLNAWSHQCDLRAAPVTAASSTSSSSSSSSSTPSSTSPSRRLLEGRTFAIKDNIAVAGLPTTLGVSPRLFDQGTWAPAAVDATVVGRLLDAGAVVRGTATCEGWCASPLSYTSFTGPVHNPWLRGASSGGSSSGCAALVAAHRMLQAGGPGLGPGFEDVDASPPLPTAELALGSDQAGSVRIPASYCGVYGLKPTFGLVPYTGAASMSPMIDHLGPLAASLDDVAAVLEVVAGYDGLDPRMGPESPLRAHVRPYAALLAEFRQSLASASPPDRPAADGRGRRRPWRVGLLAEGFAMAGVTDVVRDTVRAAAQTCFAAAGADVVDVSVPLHADGAVLWNACSRPSMAAFLLQGRCSGHLSFVPPHLRPVPAQLPLRDEAAAAVLHQRTPAAVNILLSQLAADRLLPPGLEAKAHRRVLALRAAYDAALAAADVDVLVTPCAPDLARPLPVPAAAGHASLSTADALGYAVGTTNNTAPFNATGHPALSVPCGFAARPERTDAPLPVGMQLVGRRFADDVVLCAAALFEAGRQALAVQ